MSAEHPGHHDRRAVDGTHYRHLLWMSALSFTAMYGLMYAMVNAFVNVYMNVNQAYMAGLMTAPMVLIEMAVMRAMYSDRRVNVAIVTASLIVLASCWMLIRQQRAVGDTQFLRSMIPHHAGAILMCQEAPIQDRAIKTLCDGIIASQQAEIDQMRAKLNELER